MNHLAYVYAAIASGDGSISEEELAALCEALHKWESDLSESELMPVVMRGVSTLGDDRQRGDNEQLHASIEVLARSLDQEGRAAVLDDLLDIAGADGAFLPGEGDVMLLIKQAWDAHPTPQPPRQRLRRQDERES